MRFEKPVTDSELVRRTLAGEQSAFALLMARHRPDALRVARSLTRSDEAAREAMQEATLRAYLSLDRLREPERFCEWLRGIVRNVCRERTPPYLAWDSPESEPLLPAAPDTATLAAGRADDRAVREAVALLSPALRGAVQRFYFEGWSLEETAAQLGVRVGAVKVRLHDARRRLKALLEGQFPERAFTAASPSHLRRKTMSIPVHLVEMPPVNAIMHTPVTSPETARLFLMKAAMGPPERWGVMLAADSGDWFLRLPVENHDFGSALFLHEWERFGMLTLALRLLDATGGVAETVELQEVAAGVPVAVVTVRANGKAIPVEARPTDALALAAKQNLPIRVATPLMERDRWHIPNPEAIVARILAKDTDEPFLVRVTDELFEGMTR